MKRNYHNPQLRTHLRLAHDVDRQVNIVFLAEMKDATLPSLSAAVESKAAPAVVKTTL